MAFESLTDKLQKGKDIIFPIIGRLKNCSNIQVNIRVNRQLIATTIEYLNKCSLESVDLKVILVCKK